MDPELKSLFFKKRATVKIELTRMRSYTESSEHEIHELKVRFDKLPNIWSKSETIQEVLECSDDTTDHSADQQQFENQYYYVQAKFSKLLNPVVNTLRS